MNLIKVNGYALPINNGGYVVTWRIGNETIRTDRIGDFRTMMDLRDPILWRENTGETIKLTRNKASKPDVTHYFKDRDSIWVRVGHSMDALYKNITDY